MRDNSTWKVAEVIEIRKARDPNDLEYSFSYGLQPSLENQNEEESKEHVKVEYYVSYLGIDRRNDRWVTEDMVKI